MEILLVVVMGICVLGLIVCAWGMWCNEQTYRQRILIINKIASSDGLGFGDFNKVEYDDHMWRLFFFRDPTKLYPSELNWKN